MRPIRAIGFFASIRFNTANSNNNNNNSNKNVPGMTLNCDRRGAEE